MDTTTETAAELTPLDIAKRELSQLQYHHKDTARRALGYSSIAGEALGTLRALHMAYELPDDVHGVLSEAIDRLKERLDEVES